MTLACAPALTVTATRDATLRILGFVRPVTIARPRVLSRARQAMNTRGLTIGTSHNLESCAWLAVGAVRVHSVSLSWPLSATAER